MNFCLSQYEKVSMLSFSECSCLLINADIDMSHHFYSQGAFFWALKNVAVCLEHKKVDNSN